MTPRISTASSLRKPRKIHMLTGLPYPRPCSSNLPGGRITDRSRVSVTLVVVLRTLPLAAFPSKGRHCLGPHAISNRSRKLGVRDGPHRHDSPSVLCSLFGSTYRTNLDHLFISILVLLFLLLFIPSKGVRGIFVLGVSIPLFESTVSTCVLFVLPFCSFPRRVSIPLTC